MKELKNLLDNLEKDNSNNKIQKQEIFKVFNGEHVIVTIYPSDKYAKFHDEYTQTALSIEEFKPLIRYLEKENYEMNLD